MRGLFGFLIGACVPGVICLIMVSVFWLEDKIGENWVRLIFLSIFTGIAGLVASLYLP